MKLLVISYAGIGDTLFATPLIHELRANFPDATIDAFVRWAGSKNLLENNPNVNSVYQKDLLKTSNLGWPAFLSPLRRNKYDVSINTHPQSRIHYRFVARIINAPLRISHQYDHSSVLDRLLINRSLKQSYERHCIENNLALLELLGVKPRLHRHEYELYLSEAELNWAREFLDAEKLSGRKLFGIHVGSGGTKNLALRRWPLSHYEELIRRLNTTHPDLAILLFGGPEEEKDHERLMMGQTGRGRVLHPKTKNLRQAAALLKFCDLFLSVDTALMHIAATMKVRKQIVIETPTWNKPIEPYGNPFILVRNPAVAGKNLDYYRYDGSGIRGSPQEIIKCMESVSVDAVWQAVADAVKKLT
jgi:ADP-heptose:LPS heptosyltransferase